MILDAVPDAVSAGDQLADDHQDDRRRSDTLIPAKILGQRRREDNAPQARTGRQSKAGAVSIWTGSTVRVPSMVFNSIGHTEPNAMR